MNFEQNWLKSVASSENYFSTVYIKHILVNWFTKLLNNK